MRQARDKFAFCNRTTSIRLFTSGLRQFGLGTARCLADEFKNHFLEKKNDIVSLRLEHQKETH